MLRHTYTACLSSVSFPVQIKCRRNSPVFDSLSWRLCAGHVGMWWGKWLDSRPDCSTLGYWAAIIIWMKGCEWPRDSVDTPIKGWIPRLVAFLGHPPYCLNYIYILNIAVLPLSMIVHRYKILTGRSFHTQFRHYWFCTNNVSWSMYYWPH